MEAYLRRTWILPTRSVCTLQETSKRNGSQPEEKEPLHTRSEPARPRARIPMRSKPALVWQLARWTPRCEAFSASPFAF